MMSRTRAVAVVAACSAFALGAFVAPAAPATPSPLAASATPEPTSLVAPAPSVAASPGWAPAATAAIRPGVVTETAGGGACTTNFVFTSGDRTFIGQAAHCAGTGLATETDGCDSGTGPLGTPVTIKATDGTGRAGTLAYSSWVTMQGGGESDPDTCAYNDFALVEINAVDAADVNPSIPFFGGPTGLDTDGLAPGEQVLTTRNPQLREGTGSLGPKVGASAADVGGGLGHEIYTLRPGLPGDSGSAFLDGGGAAVGILTTLNLAPLPVSSGLTDVARALDYANTSGGLGDVELALGTEPFTVTPAGVPLTALASPAGPPVG